MPRVCIGKNPGWFALAPRKGGSIPRFPDERAGKEDVEVVSLYLKINRTVSFVLCTNSDLAQRELGTRLTKFKSPKCGPRELEIFTNSQLISRSLEILTLFSTHYFARMRKKRRGGRRRKNSACCRSDSAGHVVHLS